MGVSKKDVTPLLTHWSYVFLALTHQNWNNIHLAPSVQFNMNFTNNNINKYTSQIYVVSATSKYVSKVQHDTDTATVLYKILPRWQNGMCVSLGLSPTFDFASHRCKPGRRLISLRSWPTHIPADYDSWLPDTPRLALTNGSFDLMGTHTCQGYPGPQFNIKMSSYRYRKSHCGDKTVVRSSYLYNEISYTGKMTSFYWIRALDIFRSTIESQWGSRKYLGQLDSSGSGTIHFNSELPPKKCACTPSAVHKLETVSLWNMKFN